MTTRDDRGRLRLAVRSDRATVVCRVQRTAGAAAALALADRVAAVFRGRVVGPVRFDAPTIELDGRGPDGFRAVVTLPFRPEPCARARARALCLSPSPSPVPEPEPCA